MKQFSGAKKWLNDLDSEAASKLITVATDVALVVSDARKGVIRDVSFGSVAGALHRSWADVKAKLGGGDHALLETAEGGEDTAVKTYKDALEQDLPLPIRQLLTEQQAHILTSHDYIKRHRDELVKA